MALGRWALLVRRYSVGLKLHWKKSFGWAIGTWGTTWLIVESFSFLSPDFKGLVDDWNLTTIGVFFTLAVFVICWRLPGSTKVSFRLPTTNTKIEILFGDLFKLKGHLAIPVNEFFDGQLGQYVAPTSVHGQFIQKFFQGDYSRFEAQVDSALKHKKSKVKQRSITRNNSYPIGTTAVLDIGEQKSFLFALSTTDPKTAKAHADVPMMWEALQELWRTVRASSNGEPINIPLVGGGQSHVGLEPPHLIWVILLSVLVATRDTEITKTIRVVIQEDEIERIDLDKLKAEWN